VHRVGLEYLFLVGGFAESPILQFEIRKEFEQRMKIVIPQEVSLSILKGTIHRHRIDKYLDTLVLANQTALAMAVATGHCQKW